MKRNLIASFAFLAALWAFPALAVDLHTARSQGLVGEKNDGYVTALKPSSEVDLLVADVNAKRSAKYAEISKQNGQTAAVVAKLAAPQIVQGLEPGAMYQAADGSWKKR